MPRQNIDDVIPYIHVYLIDTKDTDKERYEKYTGGDYDRFYENLLYLKEKVRQEKFLVRVPSIPFLHGSGEEAKQNRKEVKRVWFYQTGFSVRIRELGRI